MLYSGQTYQVGEQITNVKEDLTLKAVWKDKTVINPEPETPVKKGMGGGAIAVIVIFSVLGLGIGGFAIYWFVIAKKTFKQLVEICKGSFNKIFKKKK